MWRIFSFPLSQIHPAVLALQLHLPNKHMVRFREDDIMSNIVDRERDKRTMLTAFFLKNKADETKPKYLYKDFPKHYTWNGATRTWTPRILKPQRGRIVSANPAEGERYYLRLLLSNVKGPTSFEDLCTVNGVTYATFRKAALEIGLIENDDSLSQCLTEASLFQFPNALRRLFATIMIFCEPGDIRKLWNEHFNAMSEDHQLYCQSVERVQNMVLTDIRAILQSMGKNLTDFDLPNLTEEDLQYGIHREVQEEYGIVVEAEDLCAKDELNSDQKLIFDEIMTHVDNDRPGVFFIDGPGGTGKTFLYKALLAQVRSRGLIALATASSGAAANNMPGGRTAHSRFKIPICVDNNSVCNIKKQSGTAELIRSSKLIIWDEASMAKRQAIEAVDRTLQDIIGVTLPFGGKIMVMGGDFRQVLPVIKRGTRAQIVDSSLRMSPLWSITKKMRLTINMRALNDPWYCGFLLRVGDGTEQSIEGSYIRIPDNMTIPCTDRQNSITELINAVFPSLQNNVHSSDYIISRAILTTKNDSVDEINDKMIDMFQGEEKVYYSFDEAEDDHHNYYPTEFLNSLTVSGLPPHKLRLKIGCPIILLRNIDPSHGLCNGTRLICRGFQRNVIDAEIVVGQHTGKRVFLPRIPLCLSEDDMFPFKLKRKQFPIRLSFAMTINKAQGQTIPNVGVFLPDSVFSHGQLYVALSRGISRKNTKVLVHPAKDFKQPGVYTSNVVYREVLLDG
ncbi:ATP-dependent DNA helicase PIF1-like [Helianthus annuus]|uniref:ATP-dependent DNA helicase PIF1-like n=1 Tax=Helianthus annuus TaxID=4232 RepID=UPI000B8FE93B|nr:ATP-dependent DNA helicase PIF1-like [Helianthus annuus]